MGTTVCSRHPGTRVLRRCFRCGVGLCGDCAVRVGWRHFCDRGCSVIYALQRALQAEWHVQARVVRGAPVPWYLRYRVRRRRQELYAQQVARPARWVMPALPPWRVVLRPAWALLVLIPAGFVVYRLDSLRPPPPPRPSGMLALPLPRVQPAQVPAPVMLAKVPEVAPPKPPELPTLPLETDLARGPTWERKVALTFDGGAEANATSEILDTLRDTGVQATIFLTGGYIRRYPELVRRMVREGHEIGNHTMSHPHLTSYAANGRHDTLPGVTRESLQSELRQASRLFEEVTGTSIRRYWRAPYGEHNAEIRRWAAEIGYLHVGWTQDLAAGEDLDTRDWVADRRLAIYYGADQVRERILGFGKGSSAGKNGGIILLHLGTQRREDLVHRELPTIIAALQEEGYQLVPVSALHRALAREKEGGGSAFAAEQ